MPDNYDDLLKNPGAKTLVEENLVDRGQLAQLLHEDKEKFQALTSKESVFLLSSGAIIYDNIKDYEADGINQLVNHVMKSTLGEDIYKLYKDVQFTSSMGVEIECHGPTLPSEEDLPKGWKRVEDESIEATILYESAEDESEQDIAAPDDSESNKHETGEFVSPILHPNNQYQTAFVLGRLARQQATANESCGLHIHVGVQGFALKEGEVPVDAAMDEVSPERLDVIKQILVNYRAIEEEGLEFPERPFNMRSLQHVKDVDAILYAESVESLEEITQPLFYFDETRGVNANGGRDRASVNLRAIDDHGTIEFRAHSGTTNPADIMSWMRFVDKLVAKSMDMAKSPQGPHVPNNEEKAELKEMLNELQATDSCVVGNTVGSGIKGPKPPSMDDLIIANTATDIHNIEDSTQKIYTDKFKKPDSRDPRDRIGIAMESFFNRGDRSR